MGDDAGLNYLCEAIRFYREDLDNSTGGYLHIILDDGNIGYEYTWFCIEECQKHKDGMGEYIGFFMLDFSDEELEKLYRNKWEVS